MVVPVVVYMMYICSLSGFILIVKYSIFSCVSLLLPTSTFYINCLNLRSDMHIVMLKIRKAGNDLRIFMHFARRNEASTEKLEIEASSRKLKAQ